jgi:cytochrome P450
VTSGPLPPGPRLPAPLQSLLWVLRPIPFAEWCRRRYGDVFTLRSYVYGNVVMVADPDVAGEVFTGDPELFRGGEANSLLEPVAGPRSLLLLDGDRHLRERRLLLSPFHGERLARHRDLIAGVARNEVERWPTGGPLRLRPRLQLVTLRVILQVMFGASEARRLGELVRLLPEIFDLDVVVMFVPWLRRDLGRRSPWGRFRRARDRVDAILYREIARGRAERGRAERDDVLSLLLEARDEDGRPLSDSELRDELVTLLLAGHETTATALAWTFERLVRHPKALARLRAELDGGGERYLEAVVKETLRDRPVVSDVGRRLAGSAMVGGFQIPAGTLVMPSIALVHLAADSYPDPHSFRPERFLDRQPEPYTWIPFGGGARRCLGASLAMFEMKTIVPIVLERLDLRPAAPPDEGTRVRGVTLAPERDAEVVAERRRPLTASSPVPPPSAPARRLPSAQRSAA